MCVRTKTSYGCGCEKKTTSDCKSSQCTGLERYHYPRSGDCHTCKAAGSALTRGRDGKGRYGQEIRKRSQSRQEEYESPVDVFPDTTDVGNGISPWAPPLTQEKQWSGKSREKADGSWLQEHAERNFDLQSIRESLPSYPPSEHESPVTQSPSRREERIYVNDDDLHHDREHQHERRYRREDSGRSAPVEIRSVHDDHDRQSYLRVYRRRRQDSQESFESKSSSRSSTRRQKVPHTSHTYEYADQHDSGYGSYGSRRSDSYEGAKTEPYHYSPAPAPRVLSVKPPSQQSYSGFHTGYAIGPVNVTTRAPTLSYSSHRH